MILFDERGVRAEKGTLVGTTYIPGWVSWAAGKLASPPCEHGWAMDAMTRFWRPTWAAIRMSRGYRIQPLDCGERVLVYRREVSNWWLPASPEHKRLPTIMAVEAYLRTISV